MRDNEKEKKDIAFIIYYPFQWFVYKNIYKYLKDRSIFIVDVSLYDSNDGIPTLKAIISILEENNVPYKILNREDFLLHKYLEVFFEHYKVLVSVWELGCMRIRATSNILKVCVNYGAGKELVMLRPTRGMYDLILSYGDHDTRMFSLSTTTIPIGNPKFDDFYAGSLDTVLIKKLNINPHKKTLLYLPTHSDLSSFREVAPKLLELKNKYNIIVKIHYFTEREESDFIKNNSFDGISFLKDDADLTTLLSLCDLAISDNSSAIFDVIQADKPVLVADFWDTESLDNTHKQPRFYKRGITGALTYSDSIEQTIKKEKKVATFSLSSEIEVAIEQAFLNDEIYAVHRRELQKELFSYRDAQCGKRGADAILQLLNGKIILKKGILFHANQRNEILQDRAYGFLPKVLYEENKQLHALLKENHFKIAVVIFANEEKELSITIRSVYETNIPVSDCYVVGGGRQTSLEIDNINKCSQLSECAILMEKQEYDGVLFINAGIILNRTDFLTLLEVFSKNTVDVVTILPRIEHETWDMCERIIQLARYRDIYNNGIFNRIDMITGESRCVFSDSGAIFLAGNEFYKLIKLQCNLDNIHHVTRAINRQGCNKKSSIKKSFYKCPSVTDPKKVLITAAKTYYRSGVFNTGDGKYTLRQLVSGILYDKGIDQKSILWYRVMFYVTVFNYGIVDKFKIFIRNHKALE